MPELLFMRDGDLQVRWAIERPAVRLGRSADADIVIPDKSVSRQQCEVVQKGQQFMLVDRSGRGTPVSNRVAGESGTVLRDGDEIRLGIFTAVFSASAAPLGVIDGTSPGTRARAKTKPLRDGPSVPKLNARLVVRRSDGDTIINMKRDEGYRLTVGTEPTGSFQLELEDKHVSAEHCSLTFRDGKWLLKDLDSKNGTWVDRLRVRECWLAESTAIQVGETQLFFEQDARTPEQGREVLPGLITRDPAMNPLVEQVRRTARVRLNVAIHGETGAGKEVIARAVHLLSDRREAPFVAINCGALHKETVESELFGHEKGAFTGADRARAGAFEEADGGTLFLDEIGDLPLSVQVKLLRTLERGEVRRLGSTRTETVDVRIVTATHHDLAAAVEDGSFREDLYYRLCVATLELPPLRQRPADIILLAKHFASQLTGGAQTVEFGPAAQSILLAHPWYGNARELRNVVQLALMNRSSDVIGEGDLTLRAGPRRRKADTLRLAGRTMDEIEREAYRLSLERHGGDKKLAMEELDVARSTFFRRIAEFGLDG